MAVTLLEIFTVIRPPMILHSDIGDDFNTAAMTIGAVLIKNYSSFEKICRTSSTWFFLK
jgi:hypothetical protein